MLSEPATCAFVVSRSAACSAEAIASAEGIAEPAQPAHSLITRRGGRHEHENCGVSPSRSQFGALQRGLKSDNMAQEPKKVKLVDFSAASAFYGSRKGYVFKTGDQGLGYYLDNVDKAKERVLEGLEGPGLFARAPCVDVEAPETGKAPVPAPAEEPPKKKKRFDPFADLPPPKKKAAPAPKPPTPEPEEKAPVKVFTAGLFKLEQVHCLHIVRKHRDARNPTSWRHPGRRIDRSRQDATDELEKMRTKLLAGLRAASFGLRASRRWRAGGL